MLRQCCSTFTHHMPAVENTWRPRWEDEDFETYRYRIVDKGDGDIFQGMQLLERALQQRTRALLPAETPLHDLPIFPWSAAEPKFIKSLYTRKPHLATRAPTLADTVRTGLQWVDLCDVFVREPIAIPNCFDYKLKHVVKALAAIDALPSKANLWAQDSAIQDGRTAMEIAEQAYNGQQPAHVFQQLQTYNEADVLVLWDVLEGLLVGMV